LRYYFACKLTNTISDFDLNFEDFTSRVNSDLVGKITNIASRCFQMVGKNFDNELSSMEEKGREIFVKAQSMSESVATDYEERNFSKVILKVRDIADEANKYFDEKTPWKLVKEDKETTQKILTATLNIFRLMAIYLKPILPVYSEQVEKLFYEESYTWESLKTSLENKKVGSFSHLVKRFEISSLEKIIEASKQD
jgi:methionyl-tRNA synthetase